MGCVVRGFALVAAETLQASDGGAGAKDPSEDVSPFGRHMIVEGVPYKRYVITFRWADGRRARWVRWAPAEMYMREALVRERRGARRHPSALCADCACGL